MDQAKTPQTDRFGNPVDPIVRYARGAILKSTDEKVTRMLRARQIVGERVRSKGKDSVYDLSGMNRGSGITSDDVPHLTSHVPFFERFEGKTEPLALKHMGGDPAKHSALILNRVSAANFIVLTTILKPGDRVFALAPAGGVSHPSTVRPIAMAGAELREFHTFAELEQEWHASPSPRLLLITPISASKRHIPFDEFKQALALPRGPHTLVFVDDAHMASRIAFFAEPRTYEVGDVDLAVCSADKHVAGPRAGVLVGRRDLVTEIGSRAYELGLEAQAGQYVGVGNALKNFDPRAVKQAGELAKHLIEVLARQYGAKRAHLASPVCRSRATTCSRSRASSAATPVNPNWSPSKLRGWSPCRCSNRTAFSTIGAVSMLGSAPVVRLMMYPDGRRLGVERIVASLESGIGRLSKVIDDVDAAREQLLGA